MIQVYSAKNVSSDAAAAKTSINPYRREAGMLESPLRLKLQASEPTTEEDKLTHAGVQGPITGTYRMA